MCARSYIFRSTCSPGNRRCGAPGCKKMRCISYDRTATSGSPMRMPTLKDCVDILPRIFLNVSRPEDPYNLARFTEAQAADYSRALSELRAGAKRSHWMWYVFPQMDGLGHSPMSRRYSIKSAAEARAYLDHPVLGARLRECFAVVYDTAGRSALEIFEQVLEKYFDSKRDEETLRRLRTGN